MNSIPNDVPTADNLSYAGKAKLMDMSYARLRFGIMMTPIMAVCLTWFYSLERSPGLLVSWTVLYCFAAAAMPWIYKRLYLVDLQVLSAEALVATWKPRLQAIALTHGLVISLPVFITAGKASFEFAIFLVLGLATSITFNSNYQTPVLGVFLRFFFACWGAVTVFIYWLFPQHWQMMLPFAVAYGVTTYRHALRAHSFFVTQIAMEEQAVDLAARFRAAKDVAERAMESKSLFLSTASHDLRQPVFAIGMLTEAIASQNTDPEIKPLLGRLRSSVGSLNLMFNSLLDLSRIEAGHSPARQVPVNLGQLIREVIATFDGPASAAGLHLKVHLPKSPMAVVSDPVLLRQAVINLTHNALRYTQRGGVLIGVRRRGTDWQLEVWDTGIGVADSEHEKVYSPYYRNENAWRADATGHGLGLHVVARCAKLMGAKYGLTSRLGRGSRFWLRLGQADPATLALATSTVAVGATSYRPLGGRCLVVEDDPQVVNAWAALLQAWQIEARFAVNSHEAFAAIETGFEPSAIFCDERLRSGESGFDILRDLLNKLPNARGVMVSGEYASPQLAQAEDEGYLVIRKPLNIEQLYTVLSRWLSA